MTEPLLPFNFDGYDLAFLVAIVWIGWWAVRGVRREIAWQREDDWLRQLEEIERQRTADLAKERRRRAEEQAAEIVRFSERGK